jgi:hypothetical protein
MRIRCTAVMVLFSLAAIAAPVLAHHSMSKEFDTSRHVTLTGVITKVDWTNPHVWIYLNAQDADQNSVGWKIESAPPGGLQRKGIDKATLPVGTRVTVDGFPAIVSNNKSIAGVSLNLPNGKQLDIQDVGRWQTMPR